MSRITRWLRRRDRRPRSRERVFGIGLGKTGTVSLTTALGMLGFRVLHYPRDERTYRELCRREPRLSVLGEYDGITDIPAAMLFRELAEAYPSARFVLTVRDEATWLRSIQHHWARFTSRTEGEEPDHSYALRRLTRNAVYGIDSFDAERMAQARLAHHREVRRRFAAEPDRLLVLDICGGEGWEKLCPFLGRPVPSDPFPWDHATDYGAPAVTP